MALNSNRLHYLLCIACFVIILGFVGYFLAIPTGIRYVVQNHIMVLRNDSTFFNTWKQIQIPLETSIYLFEVMNSEEYMKIGKANLRQHGPFVFNQYSIKDNITWLNDNQLVMYYEHTLLYFNRERSATDLASNPFMSVNYPLMMLLHMLKWLTQSTPKINANVYSYFSKLILGATGQKVVLRQTPAEILRGRHFAQLPGIIKQIHDRFAHLAGIDMSKLPNVGTGQPLGIFTFLNNTLTGPKVVNTGSLASSSSSYDRRFLQIYSIKGKRLLDAFKPPCNALKGTDGSAWEADHVQMKRKLFLFGPICRPIPFVYDQDIFYNPLLTVRRYRLAHEALRSETEEERCYCQNDALLPGVRFDCTGQFYMYHCSEFVPFTMSLPHFLNSPELRAGFRGLAPDLAAHGSYVELDKTLGLTVKVQMAFQLNLPVFKEELEVVGNFTSILPMLWLKVSGSMATEQARMLSSVHGVIMLINGLCLLLLIGGCVLLGATIHHYGLVRIDRNPDRKAASAWKRFRIGFNLEPLKGGCIHIDEEEEKEEEDENESTLKRIRSTSLLTSSSRPNKKKTREQVSTRKRSNSDGSSLDQSHLISTSTRKRSKKIRLPTKSKQKSKRKSHIITSSPS